MPGNSASVFATVYQCVGAAVILPLYCITFVWAAGKDGYNPSGREVRNSGMLLPVVVLGYVVPTALMFYPWNNLDFFQWSAAFWQAAPLYPNLFVYLASLAGTTSPASKNSNSVNHVKGLYVLTGALSVASHFALLYISAASGNPALSLSSVLLPDETARMKDTAHGLFWIFQWDFLGTFGAVLLWTWVSVVEMHRVSGNGHLTKSLAATVAIGIATVLGGPGAALSAAWYWRETKMVFTPRVKAA
ncbi:hypothetical protein B0T14DRAFT_146790 [Immersiella caudata]|uniref:Uncharacterized protein n=1 Tax=Immersiella caudata TaxID=314043 RepID=A0AA39X6A4_9PEZI|nr:hypothetical protein B0T14DRAFT_146790 [Immersiella caudata]